MTTATMRARFLAVLGVPLAACGPTYTATACIPMDEGVETCPSPAEAAQTLVGPGCGEAIVSVDGPGTFVAGDDDTGWAGDRCCYPTTERELANGCVVGRPYTTPSGALRISPTVARGGWARGPRPDVSALNEEQRRVLATAWAEDAAIEHASVAAFSKFALELMAAGAPADLVDAAHAAARDEVRHARLAYALAEAYAGGPVAPGAFPFDGAVPIVGDLPALAAATALEGAIGETVVALLAVEALETCVDPAVRALLEVIAHDEARHAELAWRALRWMVDAGGPAVRDAIVGVLEGVRRDGVRPPAVTFGAPEVVLAAHGRLRPDAMAAMVERAMAEVVLPCMARLAA